MNPYQNHCILQGICCRTLVENNSFPILSIGIPSCILKGYGLGISMKTIAFYKEFLGNPSRFTVFWKGMAYESLSKPLYFTGDPKEFLIILLHFGRSWPMNPYQNHCILQGIWCSEPLWETMVLHSFPKEFWTIFINFERIFPRDPYQNHRSLQGSGVQFRPLVENHGFALISKGIPSYRHWFWKGIP